MFCPNVRAQQKSRTASLITKPPRSERKSIPRITMIDAIGDSAQNRIMPGLFDRRTWRKNGWARSLSPRGRADLLHRSTFLGEVSRRQGQVVSTY